MKFNLSMIMFVVKGPHNQPFVEGGFHLKASISLLDVQLRLAVIFFCSSEESNQAPITATTDFPKSTLVVLL